jgi:hypothetical protein
MTERDAKPKNTETGFRELFTEVPSVRSSPFADYMTVEELKRRCEALPSRRDARIKALEKLVLDLERSHVKVSSIVHDLAGAQNAVLKLITLYVQCDDGNGHLKSWVIDQVARILAGGSYAKLVADACAGEKGASTHAWDVGKPP